jgi:Tetratricopeptide repeat
MPRRSSRRRTEPTADAPPREPVAVAAPNRSVVLALAGLVVAGALALLLLLHGYTLRWPFISDDYIFIQQTRSGSLDKLFLGFTIAQNYFRPLGRELYFYAGWKLLGNHPFAFRVLNLAILLAIVALVFVLARRLMDRRAGVVAALVFALLYPHAVLMGWISCSQDLLATTLGTVSALLFVNGRARAAALAYFFALFCKESVAALPLILAAALAWEARGRGPMRTVRESVTRTAPLWIATLVWAVIVLTARVAKRAWVAGESFPVADIAMSPNALFEGYVSGLRAFVYIDQPWGALMKSLTGGGVPYAVIAVAAALGAGLAWWAGRDPEALEADARAASDASPSALPLAVSWTLFGTIPPGLAGHHFSAYYIAFAGVGYALLVGRVLRRAPAWSVGALLALAGFLDVTANGVESFRVTRVQAEPPGVSYVTTARLQREVAFLDTLRAALDRTPPPRGAVVYLSHAPRGIGFATAGSRAPRVWYDDPGLDLEYILTYRPEDRSRPALFLRFERARWSFVPLPNALVDAMANADGAMARGAWAEARNDLARALTIAQPGVHDLERVESLNTVGVASRQLGDTASARVAWQQALAIDPTHRGALLNWAGLCGEQGRFDDARVLVERVLQDTPDDPIAMLLLVRVERAAGKPHAAEEAWSRLARAQPQFADSVLKASGPP